MEVGSIRINWSVARTRVNSYGQTVRKNKAVVKTERVSFSDSI